MTQKLRLLVLIILIAGIISQITHADPGEANPQGITEDGLPGVESIADLDRLSDLHFAIMSDNKGDSPLSSVEFARMTAWRKEGNPAFVIGLGDHVKHRWENTFIPWLQSDPWWREHFYPNVADGENEYYSPTHRQSDYGEGAPILDLVELESPRKRYSSKQIRILCPNSRWRLYRSPNSDALLRSAKGRIGSVPRKQSSVADENPQRYRKKG